MRSLHCLTLKHDFEISAGHVPVLELNFVVVFAMKRGCVNGEKPFDCLAEYEKYIYKQYLIGWFSSENVSWGRNISGQHEFFIQNPMYGT